MPTLDEILKAAAKLDGTPGSRELKVTVEPASFASEGRGRYKAGDIVRQCRVGKKLVSAYAIEAILKELHVWDKVPAERLAALFAMPDSK